MYVYKKVATIHGFGNRGLVLKRITRGHGGPTVMKDTQNRKEENK